MWYILIIFIIIFETAVSFAVAYFPSLTSSGVDIDTMSSQAESTADLVIANLNPIEAFGYVMTFRIEGAESLSIIFIILDIILIACLIKLIRGS